MGTKKIIIKGFQNVSCIPYIKHLMTNYNITLALLNNINLNWGLEVKFIIFLGCSLLKILYLCLKL